MSDLEHALPRGTRIAGYEITGCIGAGGFGITYTAFNKFTERQVAIKEFFPDGVASRSMASTELLVFDGQEETLRWALHKFEATTTDLCRLSHPNIVRVIDYYPGNRTGYMVMEYLRGMTLKEWLADRRRPPRPAELAPMLEPVLDALEYLHGLGLIHRDIAPDNIFICDDNRPVLIDFGAVSLDRSTQGSAARPTAIIKKRSFTAPDQARGMSLPNPTADVYSLGARALPGLERAATCRRRGQDGRGPHHGQGPVCLARAGAARGDQPDDGARHRPVPDGRRERAAANHQGGQASARLERRPRPARHGSREVRRWACAYKTFRSRGT